MIETIRQGLKDDGYNVSIAKLCRWFNVPLTLVSKRYPPNLLYLLICFR